MTILADSNIPLRWAHRASPLRPAAVAAFRVLQDRGDELVLCPQVLVEFWNAATRPIPVNGLGLSVQRVDQLARRLEGLFPVVPDIAAIHEEWRRLVVDHKVSGKQVHDARLAAVMLAHGIGHILTFNVADFGRYAGITAIDPRSLFATP